MTMKKLTGVAAALLATSGIAHAGGIERTSQSIAPIFEPGTYAEFSVAVVSPEVSGVGAGTTPNLVQPTPGVASGDMAPGYAMAGFALKTDLNENLSLGLIFDQPYGADAAYPMTGYFASGTTVDLDSTALTGVLRYRLNDRFSIHAGLRSQTIGASIFIPGGGTLLYSASGATDRSAGWLAGVAYERPEIAMRIALTYNSPIEHKLATTESYIGSILGPTLSTTTVETPQSVNLEFQTGVAKDTLLFGSIRWVEWSEFVIDPLLYRAVTTTPLLTYDDDRITYTLGIGRRLNERVSVAVTASHEPSTGSLMTNLGPTDGRSSIGVGASYTTESGAKISGGVSYIWIGDANTELADSGIPAGIFRDNSALAFGFKVSFSM